MAQFQQIVLDYLEHYQPDEYRRLVKRRELEAAMDALVDQLYEETEAALKRYRATDPDGSLEMLRLQAENIAIATVLPMSHGEQAHI